jgi:hypothetical protein
MCESESALNCTSEIDGSVLSAMKTLPRAWKKIADRDVREIENLINLVHQPSLLELAEENEVPIAPEGADDPLTPDEKQELQRAASSLLEMEAILSIVPVAFADILEAITRIMESQRKVSKLCRIIFKRIYLISLKYIAWFSRFTLVS